MIKIKTAKGKFLYLTRVTCTGTPVHYIQNKPNGLIHSVKLLTQDQFADMGKGVKS